MKTLWMFSKNSGTPKSSILIGFFIWNHPFWGPPIFRKPPYKLCWCFFVAKIWANDDQLNVFPERFLRRFGWLGSRYHVPLREGIAGRLNSFTTGFDSPKCFLLFCWKKRSIKTNGPRMFCHPHVLWRRLNIMDTQMFQKYYEHAWTKKKISRKDILGLKLWENHPHIHPLNIIHRIFLSLDIRGNS